MGIVLYLDTQFGRSIFLQNRHWSKRVLERRSQMSPEYKNVLHKDLPFVVDYSECPPTKGDVSSPSMGDGERAAHA